jgi:type I restriction enzyme S subunit
MGITKSIDITKAQRKTIISLCNLLLPNTTVWAYGSRVKWTARPNSDLDLVVFCDECQLERIAPLVEAFEQSDLPFRVDLFVWDNVPEQFKKQIEANYVVIQQQQTTGNKWQTVPLTAIYDIHSGLFKPAAFFGSGYPFLAFKDVFKHFFVPDNLSQLVQSSDKERKGCSVQRGDVFLTRTSETMNELGMSSVALKDYPNATFNGFTKRLRPKAGVTIVPEYVGYYLRSTQFRSEMMAFSTMSTRASLNNDMISRLNIALPSLNEQHAIGMMLKVFDDKIELNRQMNQTLEQMAQVLFKSWFVDFDPVIDNVLAAGNAIPDELHARAEQRKQVLPIACTKRLPAAIQQLFPSEFTHTAQLGWCPKEWQSGVLEDMVTLQRGFDLPKPKRIAGDYALIQASGQGGTHNEHKVKGPGVVTGHSGKLGNVYIVQGDFWPLSTTLWIKKYSNSNPYHAYYLLKMLDLEQYNAGSAVPTLNRSHVHTLSLPIPSMAVINKFQDVVKSNVLKITENEKNITQLTKLRDTLLPKLISGELKIPADHP